MNTPILPYTQFKAAFTLIELFVVMVLVLIIAGMLIPAINIRGHAGMRKASCGNNQRQIVLGMNVYANDSGTKWPVFTANRAGQWVPATDPTLDGTATAIASLEFLTFVTGNDLPKKIFACPSKPLAKPMSEADNHGDRTSLSAWALRGSEFIGYSYDWSVPGNGRSVRVVTADSDQQVHKNVVMAAFDDGHVGNLTRTGGAYRNRDAANDDIYTAVDDGPMNTPGEGSTTRAFVR